MAGWTRGFGRFLTAVSGRFDADYYRGEYPDVAAAGIDPLEHYCRHGWREGRRPGPMAHPDYIKRSSIGQRFPKRNPIVVWMLLGRWLGWSIAWLQLREWARHGGAAAPPVRGGDLVLVVHEATRTGAPIFALTLARWLRGRGIEPIIVLVADGALLPDFWSEFKCLPLFAVARSARAAYLQSALGDAVRALYLNSVVASPVWSLLDSWRGGVVLHVHESDAMIAQYSAPIAAMADARRAIIAVGTQPRPALTALLGGEAAMIPPAIDVARGRVLATRTGRRDRPLIVGCGTASLRKGADLFCRVAALLRDAGHDARFCWIGGMGDVDMAALIAELGLGDFVECVGELADPLPLLAGATVLLLPSREDPFPLVTIEAASCGVPTVCFDTMVRGVGIWIAQGAGEIVAAFDLEAMAAAVVRLIEDADWRRAAGQTAMAAAEDFDIERIGPQIETIIRSIRDEKFDHFTT